MTHSERLRLLLAELRARARVTTDQRCHFGMRAALGTTHPDALVPRVRSSSQVHSGPSRVEPRRQEQPVRIRSLELSAHFTGSFARSRSGRLSPALDGNHRSSRQTLPVPKACVSPVRVRSGRTGRNLHLRSPRGSTNRKSHLRPVTAFSMRFRSPSSRQSSASHCAICSPV